MSGTDRYVSPLSERYASKEMQYIFSPDMKFRTWRKLWIALAETEKELGLSITDEQIEELKANAENINYDVAKEREKVCRHDVMSHVYAYGVQCPKAKGIIHLGATSCYVGDNTDIIVMTEALKLVKKKLVNVIAELSAFADKYKDQPTLAFTHFQPAQPTTVGKRATLWMQEFMMDLDDLDKKLEGVRLMLLCSPHNPTGRVWERETLQKVADLCKAHGVYLVADEIHCDFAFDRKHTSALTLDGAERGIGVAVSATKTFNIAGLKHSTFLLPDPQMREMVKKKADEIGMGGGNLLGVIATGAAYTTGDAWLKEVRALIVRNRDHAAEALLEAGAKVYPNEGTYLMWLDLRAFGMDCETLYRRLMDEAKVRLNKGTDFGAAGEGFMRLNLATTPDLCDEGVRRIAEFLKSLKAQKA
mgnify:CR=1 FL=1